MSAQARFAGVVTSLVGDLLIPLGVTVAIISYLTDHDRLDTQELRANSLLMHSRPILREVGPQDELRVALGDSAILLAAAVLIAVAVAVPAAIAYASSRPSPVKALAWTITTAGSSLPAFFWAIVLVLIATSVSAWLGLPFLPSAGFGIDNHLVLPALALAFRPASYIFRLTAITIEEIQRADFVRTGVAKGLGDRRLLTRHVLPNAAPSVIAAIAIGTRNALSSLVIVEYVFIWGGAGTLFVQALGERRLFLATELALSFAIGTSALMFLASWARARSPVAT